MAPFVSPSKARQFLRGPNVIAVHKLANAVPKWVGLFTEVYQIEGGKILVLALSKDDLQKVKVAKPAQIMEAMLFESRAALADQIQVWEQQRAEIVAQGPARAHHVLENMLPQGQEFIDQIPDLVDKLALRLKLPRQELNENFDSLGIVHKAISKRGYERALEADIFVPLVAYVGQVMKKAVHGEWDLVLNKEFGIWEPYIVDALGRQYNPWLRIFDEWILDKPAPLEWIVRYELRVDNKPVPKNVGGFIVSN